MKFFRFQKKSRLFLCIIAVTVFLRSFIAPGYMIRASADSFGIVFCDGPVSVNVQQQDHPAHQHHGGDKKVNDEIHISPVCSQWSTSSQIVFDSLVAVVQAAPGDSVYNNHYTPDPFRKYSAPVRFIRGPPPIS